MKSESLAIKISQEINYAKSLYYEQQLMLPASENEDYLLLESWSPDCSKNLTEGLLTFLKSWEGGGFYWFL